MSILFFLGAAFITGMATPWQTLVNSKIRAQLDSPFLASCVNCCTGVILLALAMLACGESFYRSADFMAALPWWIYLSGPLGAAMLVSALVLLPRLGMVGTTVAVMCGMLISGLICDHYALLGLTRHPFDPLRALGLLLVIAGILISLHVFRAFKQKITQRGSRQSMAFRPSLILWFALGCAAGTCGTVQAAINSVARVQIGSILYTALISMSITALIALLLAALIGQSPVRLTKLKFRGRLLHYSGGLMGVVNITGCALLVGQIGAGALMTLIIAGQLCCSMLLDHFAVMGMPRRRADAARICGLLLILVGMICIRLL